MLRRVTLVRTDVSEELSASIIKVTKHGELGAYPQLAIDARCDETLVLRRATRCNIPEDGILHNHRRENLKSYIAINCSHC
jgi:hypothetical protein